MVTQRQADIHKNSFEIVEDTVFFQDPFNGERLSPNRPPSSIERQPDLHAGLEYLRQHAKDIHFTMFASTHGESDIHTQKEVDSVTANSDVLFLELFGNTKSMQDLYWNVGFDTLSIDGADLSELGGYGQRQLELLKGVNKPVILPEAASDGTDFEQKICDLGRTTNDLIAVVESQGQSAVLALEISLASETIMREWFMIASMGSYMAILEQLHGTPITEPLLWIGAVHSETMAAKFAGLGIDLDIVRQEQRSKRSNPKLLHGFSRTIGFTEAVREAAANIDR